MMSVTDDDFAERVGTQVRVRPIPDEDHTSWQLEAQAPAVKPMFPGTHAIRRPGPDSQRRWAVDDNTYWGGYPSCDHLPPGLYRCEISPERGAILRQSIIDTDSLLELPDSASAEIIAEIRSFWGFEAEFRQRGFLWKRGVMLYGPPGSGKTATLQQLIKIVVNEHSGIGVFVDNPAGASMVFQLVRRIEPDRPIVALLEDLDALIERFGENEYLALLDGEAQVDNIVFVATTNYPERLDRRFVDRPSRFDVVKYIGMPSAAARRAYLLAKEPSLGASGEIDAWVARSDDLSIAHLRELIILVRCYGRTLDQAIARLQKMHARKPTSSDFDLGNPIGFG